MSSLEQVIEFYAAGGALNPELSARIHPLDLNSTEKSELLEFMLSLTSDAVNVLIDDAKAVPVGDVQRSDPDWRANFLQ